MAESHANLKVLSRRWLRQVLRLIAGLQGHRLAVLHLIVTSAALLLLVNPLRPACRSLWFHPIGCDANHSPEPISTHGLGMYLEPEKS